MGYIQIQIEHKDSAIREILIAHLAEIGFDSFEEQENSLLAYILKDEFDNNATQDVAEKYHCEYTYKSIEQENWNQQWEDSFDPVTVGNFCIIRAHFHEPSNNCEHEIIITPKMSFGTGHHATTKLMIQQMQLVDFAGRKVLDFGTGTGVLAILAKKLDAREVLAIDNDEWSYVNTIENISLNHTKDIVVKQGSLEVVTDEGYDIILANINRHILLRYMQNMSGLLIDEGTLLLSGILTEDVSVVVDAAVNAGLKFDKEMQESNWLCLRFSK